jgi:hypothetical protein
MAFPVKLGARNGGNARVFNGLRSGVFRDAFTAAWWWQQRVKRGDFTAAAATSQNVSLHTVYPNNLFPTNVDRSTPMIYVVTPLAGGSISASTITLGDAADADGLITSTSIFTGVSGYLPPNLTSQVPNAAEYPDRFEAAFSPQFTLGSTGANLSTATAFEFVVMIKFSPSASL